MDDLEGLWRDDRLVEAAARGEHLDSSDPAAGPLAALSRLTDARPLPRLDLDAAAVTDARRNHRYAVRSLAVAVTAVVTLSTSGVAAVVTGDPFRPAKAVWQQIQQHTVDKAHTDHTGAPTGTGASSAPGIAAEHTGRGDHSLTAAARRGTLTQKSADPFAAAPGTDRDGAAVPSAPAPRTPDRQDDDGQPSAEEQRAGDQQTGEQQADAGEGTSPSSSGESGEDASGAPQDDPGAEPEQPPAYPSEPAPGDEPDSGDGQPADEEEDTEDDGGADDGGAIEVPLLRADGEEQVASRDRRHRPLHRAGRPRLARMGAPHPSARPARDSSEDLGETSTDPEEVPWN